MKSRIAQFLNEIVSITIMLLMTVALIASQVTPGTDANRKAGADRTPVAIIDNR